MFNQHLFGAQVVIDLVTLACYAFVAVAALVLRRGEAYANLLHSCAERLTTPKTQFSLGIWGAALTITIPWMASALFKAHRFGILGLALIPFAAVLIGLAMGVAATWIERSRQDQGASESPQSHSWGAIMLIVIGTALPVLGWLVIICCLLPALGATAEYLVSGRERISSRPMLVEHDDGSSSTELAVSTKTEDAA